MKEIHDIIATYDALAATGLKFALATVVDVKGSSYRRPGARMLVSETGHMTGAISGGCLEGDALRKALLVINRQKNKLVTYDTREEDDAKLGVGLGCNGIIHVLFEPIDGQAPDNPIELMRKALFQGQAAVLTTLYASLDTKCIVPGTCGLLLENGESHYPTPLQDDPVLNDLILQVLTNKRPIFQQIRFENQEYSAFFEYLQPAVSLHIAGAGNDVQPIVEMAAILGWQSTVYDGRITHAKTERFPKAKQIICCKASEVCHKIDVDHQSVLLLMSHNYQYDLDVLRDALLLSVRYIGILGPKKKLLRMITDLENGGLLISAEQMNRIFGPVGLDIGAESSEEIALSILSEIKAVLSDRNGKFLRNKTSGIHSNEHVG